MCPLERLRLAVGMKSLSVFEIQGRVTAVRYIDLQ